jgi:1-acyl-sn-glycerol-3-phosphate acyltransferase
MRAESPVTRLLWLPVNALQLAFTLLWSAFWISLALAVHLVARSQRFQLALARWVWAPGLVYGAGARLAVRGRERLRPGRGVLFVANHSSWIDIPVLYMALRVPLCFLAKRELARVPFLGAYIRAMGMVFVDRRDPRRASASVDQAARRLAAGDSVVSFPEGTRSRDGGLGRFRSGGFGAALQAGTEVVPVAIVGAGRVLRADGFHVRPGRIEVRVGSPIPTTGLDAGSRAGLARRAQEAVRDLLASGAPQIRPGPPGQEIDSTS